jgi:hypothetical protein
MRRSPLHRSGAARPPLAPGALLLAFGLAACGPSPTASPTGAPASAASPSPAAQTATPPSPAAPPTAAAPTAAQPGETAALETWNAAGITIERLPGDAIRVRGTDRWGARIDTTYADATYFANAVPVFARGLQDEQARVVNELIPRVRAATSTAAAAAAPAAAPPAP